jgi:hypothetical protein
MKKSPLLFLISAITLGAYQGDRPSRYSYELIIPVVNKSNSELAIGLAQQEKMYSLPAGKSTKLPVMINHDDNNNERVRIKVMAYKKAVDGNQERVATQIYYFKAPKGTFNQVQKIEVNFGKSLNVVGKPKFNVSFKPNNLPIQ